ncbi:MAG: hypothetical protein ACOCWA_01475 [Bacteroidota bacterium]
MNKLYTIIAALFLIVSINAQSPEKMTYQALIRNSSDQLVKDQNVGMQISILQGSEGGTAVYTEIHTPSTNENGLITIEIGTGTTTDDFSAIDWASGPYFLKTEVDPEGGSSYSITGTSQLLSVPYALHATTADNLLNPPETNNIISVPAFALAISPTSTNISENGNGLLWKHTFSGGANLTLKKPADYSGGAVEFSLFFTTTTSASGVVDFFIRPTSVNHGEGRVDPGSLSSTGGVAVSGSLGFGTVYEQKITIPAERLSKDWWRVTIQREGTSSTYSDDVVLMSVALTY